MSAFRGRTSRFSPVRLSRLRVSFVAVPTSSGGVERGGELAEGAALDLAHTLGAETELVAELAQGSLVAVVEAVAALQDHALAIRQAGQQGVQLLDLDRSRHALVFVFGHRIEQQLAEGADVGVVVAPGLFQRAGRALGCQEGVDLLE